MYKFLNAENTALVHLPTSRCIYLDQPSTIHSDAYLSWVDEGNTAEAYVAPPPFVAPPLPKVESVLMVQARKALILEGVSLIEIEAIIDKMPGIQRDLARADWDTAPNVHRDNALVAYIASTKAWTPEFVDALFFKAAGIKA